MATLSVRSFSRPSYLLIYSLLLTLIAKPIFSLSFNNPNLGLLGDAEIVDGGSSVQLTSSVDSSSGLLLHRKPFKFLEPSSEPGKPISFSTEFTFSISPHNGDGIAFLIVPADFPSKFSRKSSFGLPLEYRFVGIEFDTSMDGNVGDENANHVGIDVCSLVSSMVSNISSINLVLNSGVKLRSWVDYEASSKRLEVRLGKLGSSRPYNPLLVHLIDLSEMWKEEEVFVGLSSSSGNSPQTSIVYSWNFMLRSVPKRLHSEPANPRLYSNEKGEPKIVYKKSICFSKFRSRLIFGIACGALVAFVVLFLWAIFVDKDTVIAANKYVQPVDFRYEQVNVVVEDGSEEVKN